MVAMRVSFPTAARAFWSLSALISLASASSSPQLRGAERRLHDCTDVLPPWLTNGQQPSVTSCDTWSWGILQCNKCNKDEKFAANRYCQYSCFMAGCGYDGDSCQPQTLPTHSPTPSPSPSTPQGCTDVLPPWLADGQQPSVTSCDTWSWGILQCNECNKDEKFAANRYCQYSCFMAGCGYDGDDCQPKTLPTFSPTTSPSPVISWEAPFESDCRAIMGETTGSSDHGSGAHSCSMCGQVCNQHNKQKAIYTSWTFSPSLKVANLYDVETKIEWSHFAGMREYGANGIYQAMRFLWAYKPGEPRRFGGYMGPQIKGSSGGNHLYSVWDTVKPNVDGSSVPGRRLAVPASDPGACVRNCQDCGLYPELAKAGLTSGTQCILPADMQEGQAFVYRIRMSSPSATVLFDGTTYRGTEWEVTVTDLQKGSTFVLGRVLLEGDTASEGIEVWKNFHEHLGCTPCDAFYEKTTVTGPWILEPKGVHEVKAGVVEPLDASYSCRHYRVTSLSGLSLSIETGPGVTPHASDGDPAHLFECDAYRLPPNGDL